MFIKPASKIDPITHKSYTYYSLCESIRIGNITKHQTLLQLGSLKHLNLNSSDDRQSLALRIEHHFLQLPELIPNLLPQPLELAAIDFAQKLRQKQIDEAASKNTTKPKVNTQAKPPSEPQKKKAPILSKNVYGSDFVSVDINSIENDQAREIGCEGVCFQALEELGLGDFLRQQKWCEKDIKLSYLHIIAKACYPASELRTEGWLKNNSGLAELLGMNAAEISRFDLYKISRQLNSSRTAIERYLFDKTSELFNLKNTLILYDLTNTYFEGTKAGSAFAKHGHSKEKRSDAKLLVLCLIVNEAGFIQYSKLYEGNKGDSKTLTATVENMATQAGHNLFTGKIILDAGIATDDNLKLLQEKGYQYVAVSRERFKDYVFEESGLVKIRDERTQKIKAGWIKSGTEKEQILFVHSEKKEVKEQSMLDQRRQRFEDELTKINAGLQQKGTRKGWDYINQKLGRLKQRHNAIQRFYKIDVEATLIAGKKLAQGEKKGGKKEPLKIASKIVWSKVLSDADLGLGTYFLRTNCQLKNEKNLWDIYNTIRRIEETFRCLKTDLQWRPIYHKTDENCFAHLNLGLLAYTVVNTIRHKLKEMNINYNWTTIVQHLNTQKIVTTTMRTKEGKLIGIKNCTPPTNECKLIIEALNYKNKPLPKKKFVVGEF